MKFLKEFEKAIAGEEGVGDSAEPPRYWYSTGNYCLNRIISGSFYRGIPQGRLTALVGPSGTGKSYMLGNIVTEVQKESDWSFMMDSENALDNDFMGNIGVDVNKDYIYKSVTTMPNVIKVMSEFFKGYKKEYGEDPSNGPKVFIGLDSLDMLSTESELEHFGKGESTGDQGQRAKQAKAMLRQFVQAVKPFNISMGVTAQPYQASQAQILQGEGVWAVNQAIRFSLSQIILLKKLKLRDKEKEIIGINMTAEGFKTRFTKPFQTVDIAIPYDTGIDPYSGLKEVLISLGVIQKSGSWMINPETGDKFQTTAELNALAPGLIEKAEKLSNKFVKAGSAVEDEDPDQADDAETLQDKRKQRILKAKAKSETPTPE